MEKKWNQTSPDAGIQNHRLQPRHQRKGMQRKKYDRANLERGKLHMAMQTPPQNKRRASNPERQKKVKVNRKNTRPVKQKVLSLRSKQGEKPRQQKTTKTNDMTNQDLTNKTREEKRTLAQQFSNVYDLRQDFYRAAEGIRAANEGLNTLKNNKAMTKENQQYLENEIELFKKMQELIEQSNLGQLL